MQTRRKRHAVTTRRQKRKVTSTMPKASVATSTGSATQKRKVPLEDISRCSPTVKETSKGCLSPSMYQTIEQKTGKRGADLFTSFGCEDGAEHCLLDQAPLSQEDKTEGRKRLRPKMPKEWEKKPDTWLDNFNIQHVMEQYEKAFPWFEFLGVFPMDFSAPDPYHKDEPNRCLHPELCTLDLRKEYDQGKRGIGMVFNLDPHNKGGSHWMGLYINIKNINEPHISYFDSYGMKTPPLIARFMRSFTLKNKNVQLEYNARRFQYSNTECGMYSLYFIICMIHGISFGDFCKEATKDNTMLELRKILFAR